VEAFRVGSTAWGLQFHVEAGAGDVRGWLVEHLHDHYALYGETSGVRSARKHIGWAVRALPGGEAFRAAMNTLDSADAQLRAVTTFFDELADRHPVLPAANDGLVRHQA